MNQESDEHIEDLSHDQAVKKIRDLAKSAGVCLFGSSFGQLPLTVRPMSAENVDESGNFWFLSGRSSLKNQHIARNPQVQLLFANAGDSEFLSLQGTATITDDRALKEKYWTAFAKTWFPGGVDDPELTVINVRPEVGHYWDTHHGKALAMLKIAIGAVTGKPMDVGIQGQVRP